jgi:hypothetical protein
MTLLTPAQEKALVWFWDKNGGVVDKFGRVVASGEVYARDSFPVWLNLVAKGLIKGEDDRLWVTPLGAKTAEVLLKLGRG